MLGEQLLVAAYHQMQVAPLAHDWHIARATSGDALIFTQSAGNAEVTDGKNCEQARTSAWIPGMVMNRSPA